MKSALKLDIATGGSFAQTTPVRQNEFHGFRRGTSQGERQDGDIDSGGSVLEGSAFHSTRPPVHGDEGGARILL